MAATDSKAIAPSDRASERSPLLEPLEILLGSREMEARFAEGAFGPGSPAVVNRDGRTSFEWLEGGFFLIQRWSVDHPAAPNGIAIIGAGDDGALVQHYFDSRGVARRYAMTLDGRRWTLLRDTAARTSTSATAASSPTTATASTVRGRAHRTASTGSTSSTFSIAGSDRSRSMRLRGTPERRQR
jgi:hypothetical protein